MMIKKSILIVLCIALFVSVVLNVILHSKQLADRSFSMDLRHVFVTVSKEPPDIFGVKNLFFEGDDVISIVDKNENNSIVILRRQRNDKEINSSDVIWNAIIGKDGLLRGGCPSVKRSSD